MNRISQGQCHNGDNQRSENSGNQLPPGQIPARRRPPDHQPDKRYQETESQI
jgi:hypothetical protein